MAKTINFENKDKNEPEGTPKRQWRDVDSNEVKSVVNRLANAVIDCGEWSLVAHPGAFPELGGTGEDGAIDRGNLFTIPIGGHGELPDAGGEMVPVDAGMRIRARIDNPGQNGANWYIEGI